MHKEELEDLILDLNKRGPQVFANLPINEKKNHIKISDFALIDEMSGLNDYLDNFMMTQNLPETTKDRIKARMIRYTGKVPKDIALNELRLSMFGDKR